MHTISSVFIACFVDFQTKISTCTDKLIHTGESDCSPKINKNQRTRMISVMQQFDIYVFIFSSQKLMP